MKATAGIFETADPEERPSRWRFLIALGMALINLAHVVGIFLFESAGYQGIWSRFIARLSRIGTPIAIGAALLLGLAM